MKSNEITILNHHSISLTATARCQQRHVTRTSRWTASFRVRDGGDGPWRTTHSAFASRSRYTWKVRRLAGDALASSKDQTTGWWWLEPWNFEWLSDFPIILGMIIPTDELTPWFFRGVAKNTNQFTSGMNQEAGEVGVLGSCRDFTGEWTENGWPEFLLRPKISWWGF